MKKIRRVTHLSKILLVVLVLVSGLMPSSVSALGAVAECAVPLSPILTANYTSAANGGTQSGNLIDISLSLNANGNTQLLNKNTTVIPLAANFLFNDPYDSSDSYEELPEKALTWVFTSSSETKVLNFANLPLLFAGSNYYSFVIVSEDAPDTCPVFFQYTAWNADFSDDSNVVTVNYTGNKFPVYRFWSPGFNNAHFFTMSSTEKENLLFNNDWVYEGRAFTATTASTSCTGQASIYRFWSAPFKSHFYTASTAERDSLISGDTNWWYEGAAYCADLSPGAGRSALYRFWSPKFKKHFYTADSAEKDGLISGNPDWQFEGTAYYIY